jgi:hypothetical protein
MRFGISADYDYRSNLDEVLRAFPALIFEEYFGDKDYDDSGIEIFVVLMCRDPLWNFKQRIRFSKKENCLYMDIMLNLEQMKQADLVTRKRIVAEKLVNEIPQIIDKYKFKDFDVKRFSSDLRNWFEQQGWIDTQLDSELIT